MADAELDDDGRLTPLTPAKDVIPFWNQLSKCNLITLQIIIFHWCRNFEQQTHGFIFRSGRKCLYNQLLVAVCDSGLAWANCQPSLPSCCCCYRSLFEAWGRWCSVGDGGRWSTRSGEPTNERPAKLLKGGRVLWTGPAPPPPPAETTSRTTTTPPTFSRKK
jgi:hypothetical protein